MSDYTPPTTTPNYMGMDWANSQPKKAADKIDHLADKMELVLELLNDGLVGLDVIEKELVGIANSELPPALKQALMSIAHRIDGHQKQIQKGHDRVKKIAADIDKTTDTIQKSGNSWGY